MNATSALDLFESASVEQSPANDAARAVAESLSADAHTTAEVLKELRRAFPEMPLAERVAALSAVSRF